MYPKVLPSLVTLTLATLFAASTACAASPASGTKRIVSKKGGKCEITVPANWVASKFVSSDVSAPDKSASAVISYSNGFTKLVGVKPIVQGFMKPVKTLEDTPQRLWYQYDTQSQGGTGWYVGVPGNGGICAAQIFFKSAAQADLGKRIALSVKPSS